MRFQISQGAVTRALFVALGQCMWMLPRFRVRLLTTAAPAPQTLVEKIVQRHAIDIPPSARVRSGDFVYIHPRYVMTHDNTMAVMKKFKVMGISRIANPGQLVFTLDHNVQDRTEKNLQKYREIEIFAKEQGVTFFPAGRGIGHQVMCEEGYVLPYSMVVASDSHSNMYGALGALGTPIVRTDAAAIWATGLTWWQVPPIASVHLTGQLPQGVSGKDLILSLCGLFRNDEVLNHAVEFTGPGVLNLSIEDRMTVSNMSTEWGALSGVFPVDEMTKEWLAKNVRREESRSHIQKTFKQQSDALQADEGARYAKHLYLDLSTLVPMVAGPNEIRMMRSAWEVEKEKIPINKAYIVSCVNGRVQDLAVAAEILKGKKISPSVQLYIAAASSVVEEEGRRRGDWAALVEAGAQELPPGCGPCVGLGRGLLKDNEVAISATNRNFRGRMGSRNSFAYLSSPAIVAYSALKGYIAAPPTTTHTTTTPKYSHSSDGSSSSSNSSSSGGGGSSNEGLKVLEGFPKKIGGEVVFCPMDNIDTDGIFAGKHTYREDLTPEGLAQVAMENYDPNFSKCIQKGDVLVTGYNFGTGSSREQAATSLKACGIIVLICASANATYKRNALNNGFLLIECPGVVEKLKKCLGGGGGEMRTLRTGISATVDFVNCMVSLNDSDRSSHPFTPFGPVAQDILLRGGLEAWIVQRKKHNINHVET